MNSLFEAAFYLLSILLLVPLWILVYFTRKDLQRKLIRTGFVFGIASVILGLFFTHDYWNPSYLLHFDFSVSEFPIRFKLPIEDFLYGIFFGGLTTVIYQYIFTIKFQKTTIPSSRKTTLILGIICCAIMFLFVNILKVNSIYSQIICLFIVSVYIAIKRIDLLKHMILSGFIVTLFTFLWQKCVLAIYPNAVTDFWEIASLQNIFFLGVPFEELLFAFAIGLGGALYFEFSRGLKKS